MYGYNEYTPLNTEEILKRVKEESIFKIVIQEEIIEDKGSLYKAPYRSDINPNCYFNRHDGVLRFIDFANSGKKQLNCFQFIQEVYKINFLESLNTINRKLSLGLGDNLGKVKKIIYEHDYVEEKNVKKIFKERVITILPRQFIYKDKKFWNKYEITKKNLIEDKVIPIKLYKSTTRKNKFFSIRPFDICYAYTDFPNNKMKIYRPHASKNAKWFTNCNQNDIGSISHLLKKGKLLVISKSYKDCRILRNFGINSIWFQNEGMIPNRKILKDLVNRFDKIIVWFDNDTAGITNSRIVTEYLNTISKQKDKAKSLMLPPKLLTIEIKDPSDLFKKKGKNALIEFLNTHNLL